MKILVTDDSKINREILCEMLSADYDVDTVSDGAEALKYLEKNISYISAVLLDLHMPNVDGFTVLSEMEKKGFIKQVPVLIISGETKVEAEQRCLKSGAADFIHRPFDEIIVKNRIANSINLYNYKNRLEEKVEEQTIVMKRQYSLLQLQASEIKKNSEHLIEMLASVMENRSLGGGKHIRRVKGFTEILAKKAAETYPEYNLDEKKIENIVAASTLHDIGKIAITDRILLKPGRLTPEEFEYMKSHTTRGCEIVSGIDNIMDENFRKLCYDICRHHHERYDGKGYPDGLKGENIPLSAQIVSVAEVYDGLVCEKVYKDAIPQEKAYHMIIDGECGVFSPKLMEVLRLCKREFEKFADEIK